MHPLNELTLNELAELYLSKIRSDVLDLRYRAGKWYVRVSLGNVMGVIPGSGRLDAADSLRKCLIEWEARCTL